MRKWTAKKIEERITTDWRWLKRAVLAIHSRQTPREIKQKKVLYKNGFGWRKGDAEFMTNVAEIILAGKYVPEAMYKEMKARMPKYCRQLAKIAEQNVFLLNK